MDLRLNPQFDTACERRKKGGRRRERKEADGTPARDPSSPSRHPSSIVDYLDCTHGAKACEQSFQITFACLREKTKLAVSVYTRDAAKTAIKERSRAPAADRDEELTSVVMPPTKMRLGTVVPYRGGFRQEDEFMMMLLPGEHEGEISLLLPDEQT